MERPHVLHVITPDKNVSPFDANMAYDAGYNAIVPYTNVEIGEVKTLVQDAIFSRGPRGVWRTGIFISGRDIELAMEMMAIAKKSMIPPFEVSVFADPSGAFTTSAAMMAMVELQLKKAHGSDLSGCKVSILGATGPVGGCTAVIAAKYGAKVELVAHRSMDDVRVKADAYNKRYGINIGCVDGTNDGLKKAILQNTDVALCTAAAGVRVIDLAHMQDSKQLKIVVDTNAVPPSGAEGVGAMANGEPIAGTNAVGFGAMAIGNNKYQVQNLLLKKMLEGQTHVYLDFLSAFEVARKHLD